ncbi:MAG TPA: SulP family inorganic anion transporter, partial [Thiohalobacter sp.]|nr:SulP family inorganic anion transporter [Thiohalobacter sp.]
PVIVGFTNAAALIIGLSQLSKVIGVPFPRTDSYLLDLWRVVAQVPQLHWATLAFALGAWLVIAGLRRVAPALPGVLIAVVLATLVSVLSGFENRAEVSAEQIRHAPLRTTIQEFDADRSRIDSLTTEIAANSRRAERLEEQGGTQAVREAAALRAANAVLEHELKRLKADNTLRQVEMHATPLRAVSGPEGGLSFHAADSLAEGAGHEPGLWRFSGVDNGTILLSAGGAVVGDIPQGLPSFEAPKVEWSLVPALLPAALVMALIGFMEATSISRAIATTTGERVDTSKELVGQGLANIAGSFFGSYTVSGSFSRSAVAARTGAKTGLFAIISALAVVLVLLFFTTYLYHLPQAVLAVIVMLAVFGLIRVQPLIQAWRIDRVGAVIGGITFIATLLMAPDIANGILLGVVLTVLHYLIRTMRPRAEIVSRKADGTLGGIEAHRLQPLSQDFVPVRFDGSLTFINVAYFEDIILEAHREFPRACAVLVVGSGINEIDASGEDRIHEVARRLREVGVGLCFSGLKHQVMQALEKSGLVDELGREAFFPDKETALEMLQERCAGAAERAGTEPRPGRGVIHTPVAG